MTNVTETSSTMRWLLVVAGTLVLVIGLPLFIAPGETDVLFAWTVNPPLTATFLGGSYLSACLLEWVCSREPAWANARIAVPAVLLFTTLTLIVTLVHLDKFHFGGDNSVFTQGVTWIWLLVYGSVPFIMAVTLVKQLREPGRDSPRAAPMPVYLLWAFLVQAAVMVPLGIALLIVPERIAPDVWPWQLSALTGRAIGAWLVGLGVAAAQAAREGDFARVASAMPAYFGFGVLQIVAVARFANSDHPVSGQPVLDWSGGLAWIYAVFVVSIAVTGAMGWMAAKRAR